MAQAGMRGSLRGLRNQRPPILDACCGHPGRSKLSTDSSGSRSLVLLTVLLFLASCGGSPRPLLPPIEESHNAPYLIKAGDSLEIRFYKTPQLHAKVPVRPDGKSSLELVGDVEAAGRQPAELAGTLTERYATELEHPRVSVIVRTFGGQVYVQGEVKTPSAPPFALGMTALQAISVAGGFAETAQPNSVILIRLVEGQYHGYRLALRDALLGKDPSQDVL